MVFVKIAFRMENSTHLSPSLLLRIVDAELHISGKETTMSDLGTILTGNLEAVRSLVQAAERAEPIWNKPRAQGKWSAAQVTEHVARALEESAHVAAGRPSKFPTFPSFFRPIVRALFFNRVIRKRSFPKAKTNKPFDPESGPETPAAAKKRLEEAVMLFEKECRACAGGDGIVHSSVFGKVSVEDYALFQELHTRNHTAQVPSPKQVVE